MKYTFSSKVNFATQNKAHTQERANSEILTNNKYFGQGLRSSSPILLDVQ